MTVHWRYADGHHGRTTVVRSGFLGTAVDTVRVPGHAVRSGMMHVTVAATERCGSVSGTEERGRAPVTGADSVMVTPGT
ncbi:MAG TPA: hypothetical protein VG708_01355 [Mycobacteriales bacterium]|nr:hypothetical protein [Mycobacteriales bacterium]